MKYENEDGSNKSDIVDSVGPFRAGTAGKVAPSLVSFMLGRPSWRVTGFIATPFKKKHNSGSRFLSRSVLTHPSTITSSPCPTLRYIYIDCSKR